MKEQSTTKGFAILSAAGMLVKVFSLIYIYFLLRIIGQEGYGIYSAAYQVYAFVYVLTNSGIPVAISKLISELTAVNNYHDAVKSFKMARFILFVIGMITTLLTFFLAHPIAKLLHFEQSYLSILALAPALLFTAVASSYRGYFQGRGNMTPTAVSQVLEQLINIIFTLVFAKLLIKYGIEAGCAGGTIGTTLGALISAIYLMVFYRGHKKFRVSKGYSKMEIMRYSENQLLKKIFDYGVPITVCVGMTYAGNLVDVFNTKTRLMAGGIIESVANAKYGTLIQYQQLLNVPIAIISALSMAILPAISGAAARGNKKEVQKKINYSFKTCFMISIPSAIGLAILSKPIYNMVFSHRYSNGYILMLYGSAVLILTSIVQIETTILQSIGKMYSATFYSVLGIVVKIFANYILIAMPKINILGAVFGSMLGFAVTLILDYRLINKSLRIRFSLIRSGHKSLIAGVFMGLIVYISNMFLTFVFENIPVNGYISNLIITVICIIMGAYTYLYALILNRGITKNDTGIIPYRFIKFIPRFMLRKLI